MVSAFEKLMGGDEVLTFAPPKTGGYTEPEPPNLPLVKEKMELTICVSPEAGWSELETFLGETRSTLTVAMYQFTAPHIFKAIENAVTPAGRKFELILHPVPEKPAKSGVKANDLDEERQVIDPLEGEMKAGSSTWATLLSKANPNGLFASAYHIKVAVRDGSGVLAVERQLAVVESAGRAPVRRPIAASCRLASRGSTTAITMPSSRTRGWRRSTRSTSSAISSCPRPRPAAPSASPRRTCSCRRKSRKRPVAFAAPPQFFQPLRVEPRGQRAAAAHAGQLCGERAEADQVGATRASGSRTSTSTSAAPATTSPNSSCWSERSRTRSTRGSMCASSAAT